MTEQVSVAEGGAEAQVSESEKQQVAANIAVIMGQSQRVTDVQYVQAPIATATAHIIPTQNLGKISVVLGLSGSVYLQSLATDPTKLIAKQLFPFARKLIHAENPISLATIISDQVSELVFEGVLNPESQEQAREWAEKVVAAASVATQQTGEEATSQQINEAIEQAGREAEPPEAFLESLIKRGQFAVAMTLRLIDAANEAHEKAKERGEKDKDSVRDAIKGQREKEQRYFDQHQEAQARRGYGRQVMGAMAQVFGPVLGWDAVIDGDTTSECRDANGKNFRVDVPPEIGYPGLVHFRCRCVPVPPHPNALLLP